MEDSGCRKIAAEFFRFRRFAAFVPHAILRKPFILPEDARKLLILDIISICPHDLFKC